jgi:DNA-binding NarL/FixJ family response regulator
MRTKTQIVLAEDHTIVRHGLRVLLEEENGLEVVDEVSNGKAALRAVETHLPDVLITDFRMPEMDGIELTRLVRKRFPAIGILLLSMYDSEAHVASAFRNGASGFVSKEATAENLVTAVHTILRGERYLSPPMTERSLAKWLTTEAEPVTDPYETLTAREREVMLLAVDGHSSPQIAEKLSISHRTVEVHRARLMHKLRVKNQTELVRYALQKGIASFDPK